MGKERRGLFVSIRAAWVCDKALHYLTLSGSVYLWKDTAAVNRFIAACLSLPLIEQVCMTLTSQVYHTQSCLLNVHTVTYTKHKATDASSAASENKPALSQFTCKQPNRSQAKRNHCSTANLILCLFNALEAHRP